MPEQPIIILDFTKREVRLAPPGSVCSSPATSSTSVTYIVRPKP